MQLPLVLRLLFGVGMGPEPGFSAEKPNRTQPWGLQNRTEPRPAMRQTEPNPDLPCTKPNRTRTCHAPYRTEPGLQIPKPNRFRFTERHSEPGACTGHGDEKSMNSTTCCLAQLDRCMHRLAPAVSMHDHKDTIGSSGQSPHGLFSLAKGEQARFNVAFLDITTPTKYPHLIPLSHKYDAHHITCNEHGQ